MKWNNKSFINSTLSRRKHKQHDCVSFWTTKQMKEERLIAKSMTFRNWITETLEYACELWQHPLFLFFGNLILITNVYLSNILFRIDSIYFSGFDLILKKLYFIPKVWKGYERVNWINAKSYFYNRLYYFFVCSIS